MASNLQSHPSQTLVQNLTSRLAKEGDNQKDDKNLKEFNKILGDSESESHTSPVKKAEKPKIIFSPTKKAEIAKFLTKLGYENVKPEQLTCQQFNSAQTANIDVIIKLHTGHFLIKTKAEMGPVKYMHFPDTFVSRLMLDKISTISLNQAKAFQAVIDAMDNNPAMLENQELLENFLKENKELQKIIADLEKDLAASKERESKANAELVSATKALSKIDTVEERVEDLENDTSILKADVTRLEEENSKKDKLILKMFKSLNKLEKRLEVQEQALGTVEKRQDTQQAVLVKLEKKQEAQDLAIAENLKAVNQLTSDIKEQTEVFKQYKNDVDTRILEASNQLAAATRRLDAEKIERDTLSSELKVAKEQAANSKPVGSEQSSPEYKALLEKIAGMENNLSTYNKSVETLEQGVNKRFEKVEKTLQEHTDLLSKHTEQLNNHAIELKKQGEALEAHKTAELKARTELEIQLQKAMASNNAELEQKLRVEIKTVSDRVETTDATLLTLRTDYEKNKVEVKANLDAQTAVLTQQQQKLDEYEKQLADQKQKLETQQQAEIKERQDLEKNLLKAMSAKDDKLAEELRQEINKVNEKVNETNTKLNTLTDDYDKNKAKVKETLEKHTETLSNHTKELDTHTKELDKQRETLETHKTAELKARTELEIQLQKAMASNNAELEQKLRVEIKTVSDRVETTDATLLTLRTDYEKNKVEVKANLDAQTAVLTQQQQKLDEYEKQLADQKQKLETQQQAEIKERQDLEKNLLKAMSAKDDKLAEELRQEINKVNEKVNETNTKLNTLTDDYDKNKAKVKETLEKHTETLSNHTKELDTHTKELDKQRETLETHKTAELKARTELEIQLQKAMASNNAELEQKLRVEIKTVSDRVETTDATLLTLRTDYEKNKVEVKANLDAQTAVLTQQQQKLDEYEKQLADQKQKLETQQQAEIKERQDLEKNLLKAMSAKDDKLAEELRQEINKVNEKVNETNTKLNTLTDDYDKNKAKVKETLEKHTETLSNHTKELDTHTKELDKQRETLETHKTAELKARTELEIQLQKAMASNNAELEQKLRVEIKTVSDRVETTDATLLTLRTDYEKNKVEVKANLDAQTAVLTQQQQKLDEYEKQLADQKQKLETQQQAEIKERQDLEKNLLKAMSAKDDKLAEELRQEINKVNEKVNETNTKLNTLTDDYDKNKAKVKETLEKHTETLSNHTKELDTHTKELDKQRETLETHKTAELKARTELEIQLQKAMASNNAELEQKLRVEIKTVSDRVETTDATLLTLRTDYEKNKVEVKANLDAQTAVLTQQQQKLDEYEKQLADQKQKLETQQQAEIKERQDLEKNLLKAMSAKDDKLAEELRQEINKVNEKVNETNTKLNTLTDDYDKNKAKVKETLEKHTETLSNHTKELDTHTKELDKQRETLETHKTAELKARTELEIQLQKAMASNNAELEQKLRVEIKTVSDRVETTDATLLTLRTDYEKNKVEVKANLDAQTAVLTQQQQKLDEYEKQLEDQKQKLEIQQQTEIKERQDLEKNLLKAMSAKDDKLAEELRQEINKVNEKVNETNTKLNTLTDDYDKNKAKVKETLEKHTETLSNHTKELDTHTKELDKQRETLETHKTAELKARTELEIQLQKAMASNNAELEQKLRVEIKTVSDRVETTDATLLTLRTDYEKNKVEVKANLDAQTAVLTQQQQKLDEYEKQLADQKQKLETQQQAEIKERQDLEKNLLKAMSAKDDKLAEELRQEINKVNEKVNETNTKLNTLTDDYDKNKAKVKETLEKHTETLFNHTKELDTHTKELDKQRETLETHKTAELKARTELEIQLQKAMASNNAELEQKLRVEIKTVSDRVETTDATLLTLRTDYEKNKVEVKANLDAQTAVLTQQQQKLDEYEKQLEDQKQKLEIQQQTELKAREELGNKLLQAMAKNNTDLAAELTKQIEKVDKQVNETTTALNALKNDYNTNKEAVADTLRQHTETLFNHTEQLKDHAAQLEEQIKALETHKTAELKARTELETRLQEAVKANNTVLEQKLEVEKKTINERVGKIDRDLSKLSAKYEENMAEVKATLETQTTMLTKHQQTLAGHDRELGEQRQTLEAQKRAELKAREELTRQLADKKGEDEQLKLKIQDLDKQVARTNQDLGQLTAQTITNNSEIRENLKAKEQTLNHMQQTMDKELQQIKAQKSEGLSNEQKGQHEQDILKLQKNLELIKEQLAANKEEGKGVSEKHRNQESSLFRPQGMTYMYDKKKSTELESLFNKQLEEVRAMAIDCAEMAFSDEVDQDAVQFLRQQIDKEIITLNKKLESLKDTRPENTISSSKKSTNRRLKK